MRALARATPAPARNPRRRLAPTPAQLIDENTRAFYAFYVTNRWLSFRLDLITSAVATITALFIVASKGSIEPAFAGLAITYALQMAGMFQARQRSRALAVRARVRAQGRSRHGTARWRGGGPGARRAVHCPPRRRG
jgi:hypothetical protein